MQEVFPKNRYKYYSMSVVEKYNRPCFFVQLKVTDTSPANYNSRNINATLYIDYFQKTVDESEAFEVLQKLMDKFGLAVKVGTRYVGVENVDWDFTGTEKNHLQITVDLQWMERIKHEKENLPLMKAVEINYGGK